MAICSDKLYRPTKIHVIDSEHLQHHWHRWFEMLVILVAVSSTLAKKNSLYTFETIYLSSGCASSAGPQISQTDSYPSFLPTSLLPPVTSSTLDWTNDMQRVGVIGPFPRYPHGLNHQGSQGRVLLGL